MFDYIYYCIYQYVLKTLGRAAVDAAPHLFLVLTVFVHAFFAYELVALSVSGSLWSLPSKPVFIGVLVLLMIVSYCYYVSRGNGARVVRSYDKRGNQEKYARMGAAIWYETWLLPFIIAGILILSQKLTGWPPHP